MSYGCIIMPMCGSWRRQFPLCRLRFTDSIARPLPGVLAYQPAGSPHIERVRLPYAAPCAFFVKVPGLVSPQRHTVQMCFCGMARSGGQSARPCFHASSGKGDLQLRHLKGRDFCYQLGFQSAAQFLVNVDNGLSLFVIHGSG